MVEAVFVLAAGRGERLRPLTDKTPKPLLEVNGRPLLDHVFDHLVSLKPQRVVLNAWHLKSQIVDYAKSRKKKYSFEILVSEEDELLGTAGGLRKALPLLKSKEILMMNGDCLWKGDLSKFLERGRKSSCQGLWWLAPAVQGQTLISVKNERVVGLGSFWGSKEEGARDFCFSGIQWIRNLQTEILPVKGCIVRNYWVPLLQNGHSLGGTSEGLSKWVDLGTVESLREAQEA